MVGSTEIDSNFALLGFFSKGAVWKEFRAKTPFVL
jgi:hypothetical protein